MDFLDLLAAALPFNFPGSRRASAQENIAGAVGFGVFPILDFFVVLLGGLYENTAVAGIVLPVAFGVGSFAVCRLLRVSTGWTLLVSFACLALCMVASGVAILLAVFASFYSGF